MRRQKSKSLSRLIGEGIINSSLTSLDSSLLGTQLAKQAEKIVKTYRILFLLLFTLFRLNRDLIQLVN